MEQKRQKTERIETEGNRMEYKNAKMKTDFL